MICEKCGAELNDGSMFCNKCGAKIESGSVPVAEARPVAAPIHTQPNIEKEQEQAAPASNDIGKSERDKKFGIIESVVSAIGGIALLIVVIVMFNVDWRIDTRIMCGLSWLCLIGLIFAAVLDIANAYIRKEPAKESNVPLICSVLGLVLSIVAFGYNPYCIIGTVGCFLASEGTGGKIGSKVMGYIGMSLCVIANFVAFDNALKFDPLNQFIDKIL